MMLEEKFISPNHKSTLHVVAFPNQYAKKQQKQANLDFIVCLQLNFQRHTSNFIITLINFETWQRATHTYNFSNANK